MTTPRPAPIPEEWLSGYLDGELSAEEAAAVEAAVAGDAALAAQLEAIRELQSLLQSLPRPSVEGSVLAGRSLDEPAADVRPGGTRASGRLVGILTAATALGLAGVAAVILLPPVKRAAVGVADNAPKLGGAAEEADAVGRELAEGADFAMEPMPAAAAEAPAAEAPKAAGSAMVNPLLLDGFKPTYLSPDADVPRTGELVEILSNDPNAETRVVEWVVADVDTSLGELRLLLQRNGVPETAVVDAETDDAKLRAVYVQAPEPVMQKVLARTRFGEGRMSVPAEAEGYGKLAGRGRADAEPGEPAGPPADRLAGNGYADFEATAEPDKLAFQKVLPLDDRAFSAINGNFLSNGLRKPVPAVSNRLLVVLRERDADADGAM